MVCPRPSLPACPLPQVNSSPPRVTSAACCLPTEACRGTGALKAKPAFRSYPPTAQHSAITGLTGTGVMIIIGHNQRHPTVKGPMIHTTSHRHSKERLYRQRTSQMSR